MDPQSPFSPPEASQARVIPAFWRLTQEDLEFEASLGFTARFIHLATLSNTKQNDSHKEQRDQRRGSGVQGAASSCRRPGLSSSNPHGHSQRSLITVPGCRLWAPAMYHVGAQTYMPAKYLYIENENKRKNIFKTQSKTNQKQRWQRWLAVQLREFAALPEDRRLVHNPHHVTHNHL